MLHTRQALETEVGIRFHNATVKHLHVETALLDKLEGPSRSQ